jgi:hypothetical protein
LQKIAESLGDTINWRRHGCENWIAMGRSGSPFITDWDIGIYQAVIDASKLNITQESGDWIQFRMDKILKFLKHVS